MSQMHGIAGGDINPSRFVKHSTAADYTFLEASTGERTVGVSQAGQQDAPIAGSSALAGSAGRPIRVFTETEECLLELGAGGCTAGAMLKADAAGKGVATAVANDLFGAISRQAGSAGEKVSVYVRSGKV